MFTRHNMTIPIQFMDRYKYMCVYRHIHIYIKTHIYICVCVVGVPGVSSSGVGDPVTGYVRVTGQSFDPACWSLLVAR